MKTCADPSPATGSRRIRTPVISMSSTAHPVTGIDPVTPVLPSTGVSIRPVGMADAPLGIVVRATVIGPAALAAPVNASAIVPFDVPRIGKLLLKATFTVNVADPVPAVGDSVIHGRLGV